jgi:type II secretory pathway component PulJ
MAIKKAYFRNSGFTLAEALAALIISVMIMITAVGIYMGVKRAENSINQRLQSGFLATEVLQRIAEDIDRVAISGADITMTINNKIEEGVYKSSKLVIENKIYDKDNKPQVFEKIVWQSRFDPDANGLAIYRSHSGYTLEDKMLDAPKEKYEAEKYIPICGGATIFDVQAVEDGNAVTGGWQKTELPKAVKISLSFASMQQDSLGGLTVPEELIKSRTIAIDRFSTTSYQFVAIDFNDVNGVSDANDVNNMNDINLPDMNSIK